MSTADSSVLGVAQILYGLGRYLAAKIHDALGQTALVRLSIGLRKARMVHRLNKSFSICAHESHFTKMFVFFVTRMFVANLQSGL